jgi:methylthioribose-1-phosphate isomerase
MAGHPRDEGLFEHSPFVRARSVGTDPWCTSYRIVSSIRHVSLALQRLASRSEKTHRSACELLQIQDTSKSTTEVASQIQTWCTFLLTSRPTAVNLREAMDRIQKASSHSSSLPASQFIRALVAVCKAVWSDDIERNYTMGDNGANVRLFSGVPEPF